MSVNTAIKVWILVEHDRGELSAATAEAVTGARGLSDAADGLGAIVLGDYDLAASLGALGITDGIAVRDAMLADYGPEAWGEALSQVISTNSLSTVVACGTERGNEVMAQAAARLDAPMVANVTEWVDGSAHEMVRVRWGGSLLERTKLDASAVLATVAHHSFEPAAEGDGGPAAMVDVNVELDPSLARTVVASRVERAAGVTLGTAPVVVGGGRGVGSADAFAPLEELAGALGGVVGCSRAVTNNGWRNHTDQVGQTGTRIAPDIYIAAGISGAIQHWVGAMASKYILAINTDPEANMVQKADAAVIGDLHEVIPAITAELKSRQV